MVAAGISLCKLEFPTDSSSLGTTLWFPYLGKLPNDLGMRSFVFAPLGEL